MTKTNQSRKFRLQTSDIHRSFSSAQLHSLLASSTSIKRSSHHFPHGFMMFDDCRVARKRHNAVIKLFMSEMPHYVRSISTYQQLHLLHAYQLTFSFSWRLKCENRWKSTTVSCTGKLDLLWLLIAFQAPSDNANSTGSSSCCWYPSSGWTKVDELLMDFKQ